MNSAASVVANKTQPAGSPQLKWSVVTVCVLMLLMLGVEAAARYAVPRMGRIEGRIHSELNALFSPGVGNKPVVVVAGNSLLDAAVDFPSLRKALEESVDTRRFLVEQTAYYDWYYGLKRLLAKGITADRIVLMLSPGQLVGERYRGEYSAQLLMAPQDAFQLAREASLHPTDTANLVFASISSFYGLRSEIRKVLLGKLMPDVPQLTARLITTPLPLPADREVERIARLRLKALDDLCRRRNVQFTLLLAPSFGSGDRTPVVLHAAQSVNVSAVAATTPSMFTKTDFPDGYHASPAAAKKYTVAAVETLRPLLHSGH